MEFSELYAHYDQIEKDELEFKRGLEAKVNEHYKTFYEKWLIRLKSGPIVFSISFGLILFLLHLGASFLENNSGPFTIAEDFSFFLAVLNMVGLFLMLSATEKLREFIVNLVQLTKGDNSKISDSFLSTFKNDFLGLKTIAFGVLFGLINMSFAYIFGIQYLEDEKWFLLSTFLLQVFTIGFIGGVTVNATIVVVKLINSVSIKENIDLMYFYPDKCAGTLVIGNILFVFSIHFILIGIFTFLFIHGFEWTNQSKNFDNYYVDSLIVFWKTFPFILAGVIFFIPVKKINAILKEYKLFEQLRIRRRLDYLTKMIISLESDNKESRDKIEILDNHFNKLSKIDSEIDSLNTWPYNLKYRAAFLSIFLPVVIGSILEISKKLISGLF